MNIVEQNLECLKISAQISSDVDSLILNAKKIRDFLIENVGTPEHKKRVGVPYINNEGEQCKA